MKVDRNQPCPCGSGKKGKKCHPDGYNVTPRGPSQFVDSLSLLERTQMLIAAAREIFGFSDGRSWSEVKAKITGQQVREWYEVRAVLWPRGTNADALLPPDDGSLRALYLGDIGLDRLARSVSRFGLYTDEILIVDPVLNPWAVQPELNPLENPGRFKADTLKLLAFLFTMEPLIRSDVIKLIPNLGDFDTDLFDRTCAMALARRGASRGRDIPESDLEEMKSDLRRVKLSYPDEYIERLIREKNPDATPELIRRTLAHIRVLRRDDPIALDQTMDRSGQMTVVRAGANLELGIYVSQRTGAFPATNLVSRWNEILAARNDLSSDARVWSPLTESFGKLDFKFLDAVDTEFSAKMREEGRLAMLRQFLREVWRTAADDEKEVTAERTRAFSDQLTEAYQSAKADWSDIDRSLAKWTAGVAAAGAVGEHFVTGRLGMEIPGLGFVVSGVTQLLLARHARNQFRRRVPMSVFVDLAAR